LGERARLQDRVLPWLASVVIRGLRATVRIEWRNRDVLDALRRDPGAYILAFWHSRFVMMPYAYFDRRMVVLTSAHRDGRRLADLLAHFGIGNVMGSSTRGGAGGLRGLMREARAGSDLALTPDGPRGPRRRVKPGVIAAARFTGLPIVPVTYSATRGYRLRSWDLTLIPRPFSKLVFAYGAPIFVPRDIDEDDERRLSQSLEREIDRLTDELDRQTGLGAEPPKEAES